MFKYAIAVQLQSLPLACPSKDNPCTCLLVFQRQMRHCNHPSIRTVRSTSAKQSYLNVLKLNSAHLITLPSGGWTSKKNVRLMYQPANLPNWTSSQLRPKSHLSLFNRFKKLICFFTKHLSGDRVNRNEWPSLRSLKV